MVKKTKRRSKHIPQRTCVGCREILPKRSLIRIVKSPDGVLVDPTGKAHGRGAYLHDQKSCWMRGIKSGLGHALKAEVSDQEKQALLAYMAEYIPDDEPAMKGAEEISG